jgi:malate permease and related proteins
VFFLVLEPLLLVLIVCAIGFIFGRFFKPDLGTLSNALIYITGPALIFSSIYQKELVLEEFFWLSVGLILVIVFTGLLAKIFLSATGRKENSLLLPAMFMNSGYLGYPIALFAFGEIGLNKAILIDAIETIVMFSAGLFLVQQRKFSKKQRFAEIFKIPLIYAIVLAIAFNQLSLPFPALGLEVLSLLGAVTIPLALLMLGARLSSLKISSIKIPAGLSLIRIAGGFFIAVFLVQFLNISPIAASVFILIAAMPSAVNSYVLNEKYAENSEIAASTVLLSTLISFGTIALILAFF